MAAKLRGKWLREGPTGKLLECTIVAPAWRSGRHACVSTSRLLPYGSTSQLVATGVSGPDAPHPGI